MKKIKLEWLSSVNLRNKLGCTKFRSLKNFHDVLTDQFQGIVYKVDQEELDDEEPELGVNEAIPYVFYDEKNDKAYIAFFDISFYKEGSKEQIFFSVNDIMDDYVPIKDNTCIRMFYTDNNIMSCITEDGLTLGLTKI